MASKEIPGIVGIGGAEGGRRISNGHIAELLNKRPKVVDRLMKRVGINSRNWCEENIATSDLATDAVKEAMKMANVEPEDIRGIKVATMTPDHPGSPVAVQVQANIGAPNMGEYNDLSAACAGFIHALHDIYLDLTSDLSSGGPKVVAGADTLSKFLHPGRRETFPVFGDGAGAVVVKMVPDKKDLMSRIAFQLGADGRFMHELYIPAGGSRTPTSVQTVTSKDNLHSIHMNGDCVEENAVKRMKECIEIAIKKSGVSYGDILLLIPHQANVEIIDGLAEDLGFPMDRIYKNIKEKGNTSAASIPLAMRDAYFEGKLRPDELIAICSFGAGFEFAAAVIPLAGLPKRGPSDVVRGTLSKISLRVSRS